MGKAYSNDLRERIVGAVEAGRSRRGAARHFGVSASCAIKLLRRWETTGSAKPDRQGAPIVFPPGQRKKLAFRHLDRIRVARAFLVI